MGSNSGSEIKVFAGAVGLDGILCLPSGATAIVVFAHGSGSSRLSPRNQFVAKVLQSRKFATLLFDLLTPEEEGIDMVTAKLRFDIALLSRRLVGATDWLVNNPKIRQLRIGYFGASTGAAAALVAAAQRDELCRAVVSRGGRPDLAKESLSYVLAPTLLIVGENDPEVIELNRRAFDEIKAEKKLAVVPKASHLFEEPHALEQVAQLAGDWFKQYL